VGVLVLLVVGVFLLILVWLLLHYGKGTRFSVGAKIWKVLEVDLKFGADEGNRGRKPGLEGSDSSYTKAAGHDVAADQESAENRISKGAGQKSVLPPTS
jgi:hypothetical protein